MCLKLFQSSSLKEHYDSAFNVACLYNGNWRGKSGSKKRWILCTDSCTDCTGLSDFNCLFHPELFCHCSCVSKKTVCCCTELHQNSPCHLYVFWDYKKSAKLAIEKWCTLISFVWKCPAKGSYGLNKQNCFVVCTCLGGSEWTVFLVFLTVLVIIHGGSRKKKQIVT